MDKDICRITIVLLVIQILFGCEKRTALSSKPDSPQEKTSYQFEQNYYNNAITLSDSAHFDSSNILFQKAATQYYRKQEWHLYLRCKNRIGANYQLMGNLDKANQIFEKNLNFGLLHLPDSSAEIARTYNYLGELATFQGKLHKADSLLHLALNINHKLNNKDYYALAESLRGIGEISYKKAEYENALHALKKSLNIYQNHVGIQDKSAARCYMVLGNIYYQQQLVDSAFYMYKESLAIIVKNRGRNHPERGKIYANLGMISNAMGDGPQAIAYYQKALNIYKIVLGERNVNVAIVYNNLGNTYEDKGDYERAIAYYMNAVAIFLEQFGEFYPDLGVIYGNLGVSYYNLGYIDKAIESYRKALQIIGKVASPVEGAYIHNNLGQALAKKGQIKLALANCNKALDLYSSDSTEEDYQLGQASCYSAIAEIFMSQHAYDKANFNFEKSLRIYTQISGRKHPHVAGLLTDIGDAWLGKDELDSASFYYDQSIKSLVPHYTFRSTLSEADLQKVAAKNHLARALVAKAKTFRKKYDQNKSDINLLKSALTYYQLTTQAINMLRQSYKGEEAKLLLNSYTSNIYQQGLETATLLYELTHNSKYIDQAFIFSEKGKASVLLEVTKQIGAAYKAGIPDSIVAIEDSLRSRIAFYERKLAEVSSESSVKGTYISELQSKLAETKRYYAEFVERIEKTYPNYYSLKFSNTVARIKDVQKILVPSQSLIEFAFTDSLLYIFAISPTQYSLVRVSNDSLIQRVQLMRAALINENKQVYVKEAHNIYNSLLAPLEEQLKGVKRLIIIPDMELSYVPFEILLKEKPEPSRLDYSSLNYLVKDYQMSYHYSATLLLDNHNKKYQNAPKSFLGLAPSNQNISLAKTVSNESVALRGSVDSFPDLPGSREEVEKIAKMFRGNYYLNNAANKALFKSLAPQYNIIHLATHGLIDDEHPNLSKLVFYSENKTEEDRYLYAYELYNLKLRAELVTLSACNTGVGKLQKGEGVISFARGFAYAGCPAMLVSLWPATDKPTSRIMQYFYEGLKKGLAKDDALYQAKLQYLNSADDNQSNPALWGSFVIVGNAEPLHKQSSKILPFLIAGLCLLVLIFAGLLKLKQ
ncbi:CHAT domain-containing protein [Adhaeribacter radiodurans]|uniref:CHAT domain-containing protein n=1 Tax=Adhaeribacter radiodurans TaxID=2745197 RepID=A0A7L7LCQ2_9BACT|nr:CHAT domain-containing protein [Adhaeribacter radiodurans]QMU30527.1 CHAT domain-containing protein [Adhaeribacter radiodurans]